MASVIDTLLQNVATTGSGDAYDLMARPTVVTFYITSFTGTWAPITGGLIAGTTVTGGAKVIVQCAGPLRLVRARVSTTIAGTAGTVTVRLIAAH